MLSQTNIGRYKVVSVLGQGAMGTVYKAVDPLIERTVAIKTINLNLSKEERAEFEERFYREAKSAGQLSHANIVTIYDVGETDDVAYIAMEYVKGESLREMLDSGVVLTIEMIVRIASRIASGLNYAHENHVVHRDIKPANIMITPGREVKIMDFGIAQIPTGSRTQQGTVLGSPKYMAPEQIESLSVDGKTDIFALGVVLYEMLTGTTPFNGDSLNAIMYKVLNETPVSPSTINPRVPPVFDRIISRALSKRPEDRYQTAREFARDLRRHDAAPLGEGPQPAIPSKKSGAANVNKAPAGPFDATVFLPPHKARAVNDGSSSSRRPGIRETTDTASRKSILTLRPIWFALPVLVIAIFVFYWQSPPRTSDTASVAAVSGVDETGSFVQESINPPAEDITVEIIPPLLSPPVLEMPNSVPRPRPRPNTLTATPPAALNNVAAPVAPVAPAAQAIATVLFAVSPWGEVFVDGKSVGVSPPLNTLQLEAGKHKVEIRNQGFTPYSDTVNLAPEQSLKIRHKFR